MHQKLVSLIVPCYNVAPYISRFLDSVANQTYKTLELIFVDDGSTDNTFEIIRNRLASLEGLGYTVKIISQENRGLSSAVNTGLKHFTGDYLTWPDPDDWLAPYSIEKRIHLFEQHPLVGTIRSNAEMINAKDGKSLGFFTEVSEEIYNHLELFTQLAHITTYFAPVCYMVRSEYFLKVNPNKSIYCSREAMQNLQMLLPITYAYQSLHVNQPLSYYLVREGSLSRAAKNSRDVFRFDSVMCSVSLTTLSTLADLDSNYIPKLKVFFIHNKLAPGAFRARLKETLLSYLPSLDLTSTKRAACRCMIALRCSTLNILLQRLTFNQFSRVECKLFVKLLGWRMSGR